MTHAIRFSICLCIVGCGTPEVETEPADATSPCCTTQEQDWNGDGDPEIVETLDADGRIISVEAFAGTVDAYQRSFAYDLDGRLAHVTTETALGTSRRAFPVWGDDGLIVAVQRVWMDAEGVEHREQTRLDDPCGAPYRCMDEC